MNINQLKNKFVTGLFWINDLLDLKTMFFLTVGLLYGIYSTTSIVVDTLNTPYFNNFSDLCSGLDNSTETEFNKQN